jgi:hypothetical protein
MHCQRVRAPYYFESLKCQNPSLLPDAGRITTQLGTPRGRYDEHSSKFSLSKKLRFVDPVGKSQTSEGDAC